MVTGALKELFNAYKHLPVGVIFFKDEKLFFVNDHLHEILLLENLSSDSIVEVIGSMLELENPAHDSLYRFLSENPFLTYKNRIIQIGHNHVDNLDIFVLMRISDATVGVIDQTRTVRQLLKVKKPSLQSSSSDQHELLTKTLGKWEEGGVFVSVVLYKGIPIKGDCQILEVQDGELKIHVDKKQMVAAKTGTGWLIGSKKEKMVSGKVTRYDLKNQFVWIDNIEATSKNFNRRSVIRYEADENDTMVVTVDGKKRAVAIRDVSEQGVSVILEDTVCLASMSVSKPVEADLILNGKKVAVKALWLYNVALDDASRMKAAFKIEYDKHNGILLREWLNTQQLRLIKEVRNFVQMISSE